MDVVSVEATRCDLHRCDRSHDLLEGLLHRIRGHLLPTRCHGWNGRVDYFGCIRWVALVRRLRWKAPTRARLGLRATPMPGAAFSVQCSALLTRSPTVPRPRPSCAVCPYTVLKLLSDAHTVGLLSDDQRDVAKVRLGAVVSQPKLCLRGVDGPWNYTVVLVLDRLEVPTRCLRG